MTGPEPKSADLIAAEPTTILPWELVRDVLRDTRLYWLATVHPTGRPHVRPVLAVWLDGAVYTTSADKARKGRNLAADPRCTVTARTDTMDVVLEGTATRVTKEATLQQIAEAYRSKYSWPVTVTDGAFDAPYGAPTAGPPPYQPYKITPQRSSASAPPTSTPAARLATGSDHTETFLYPERSGVPAPPGACPP